MDFKKSYLFKIVLPSIFFYSFIYFGLNFFGYSAFDIIKDNRFFEKGIIRGLISNLGISLWISTGLMIIIRIFKNKENSILNYLGIVSSFYLFFLDLYDYHNRRIFIHDFSITGSLYYLPIIFLSSLIFFALIKENISEEYLFYILIPYLCLIGSIFVDFYQSSTILLNFGIENSQLFEELLKFLGIVGWFYFWFKLSKR